VSLNNLLLLTATNCSSPNAKAVPLHARKALGWRGAIAPTHSRPRHSSLGRALAPVPTGQEAGWAPEPGWSQRLQKKSFRLCRGSNLDRPVVQPVARHCIDWATRLICSLLSDSKLSSALLSPRTVVVYGSVSQRTWYRGPSPQNYFIFLCLTKISVSRKSRRPGGRRLGRPWLENGPKRHRK
jgi:hypothetical protein